MESLRTIPPPLAAVLMLFASGQLLLAAPADGDKAPSLVADGVEQIPKPALPLANRYQEGVDLSGYWVSEKLDGVRAYWDGHRLISRGGHLIRAPAWFTAGFPAVPLDGELWMGRGLFESMSGVARQLEPEDTDWREVRYMVFDLPLAGVPFGDRLERLRTLIHSAKSSRLRLVEQSRLPDHRALMSRLDAVVAAGGEGLMLHRDDALYQEGRSDALLKVKLYQDAEAMVVAHLPGKGKYEGMLGALLVEDASGRRFRLGTGFSDEQRLKPPPIGSQVTYKFLGLTEKGLPRFASFLRVRAPE